MNHLAAKRYERDASGMYIIDIAASRVSDLYNNFDKHAPFVRRELDPDLVDYLIDCAKELHRLPFHIRLTFEEAIDDKTKKRLKHSVSGYFEYLLAKRWQKSRRIYVWATVLFSVGVTILFTAVSIKKMLQGHDSTFGRVGAEGLTVAAWVALWQSFVMFVMEWFRFREKKSVYHRLAVAELLFCKKSDTACD